MNSKYIFCAALLYAAVFCFASTGGGATDYAPEADRFIPSPPPAPPAYTFTPVVPEVPRETFQPYVEEVPRANQPPPPEYAPQITRFEPQFDLPPQPIAPPPAQIAPRAAEFRPEAPPAPTADIFYP